LNPGDEVKEGAFVKAEGLARQKGTAK
jgi:hypothetical protein